MIKAKLECINHSKKKAIIEEIEISEDSGMKAEIKSEVLECKDNDMIVLQLDQPFTSAFNKIDNLKGNLLSKLCSATPCSPTTYDRNLLKKTKEQGGSLLFSNGRSKSRIQSGIFTEYYDSPAENMIKFEACIDNNKLVFDGKYTSYNRDQKKIATGVLKNNKPVGDWVRFNDSENQTITINFNENNKADKYIRVYNGYYVDSKYNKIILEMEVKNGKPDGSFFYQERNTHEVIIRNRKVVNTIIGKIKGENIIGNCIVCRLKREISMINFENGKPIGKSYSILMELNSDSISDFDYGRKYFINYINNIKQSSIVGAIALGESNGVVYDKFTSCILKVTSDNDERQMISSYTEPKLSIFYKNTEDKIQCFDFRKVKLHLLQDNKDRDYFDYDFMKITHKSVNNSICDHFNLDDLDLSFIKITNHMLSSLKELKHPTLF